MRFYDALEVPKNLVSFKLDGKISTLIVFSEEEEGMYLKEDQGHFKFGENWRDYSGLIDEERIEAAKQSILDLISIEKISGKSFMDFGCGSGLFSIAAAKLGAWPVIGIDLDIDSIQTSNMNNNKWMPDKIIQLEHLSVLNENGMEKLPLVDIGYAWGSLHQTGSMRQAIKNCSSRIKPGGIFVIAIYNRHWTSPIWYLIKKIYVQSSKLIQDILVAIFTPLIIIAKVIVTGKNPFKFRRGMNMKHNIIDWVGGFPYEYASIDEMKLILSDYNLVIEKVIPSHVPTGCNEFVCKKICE